MNTPDCIRLGREICGDLAQAERREWWLANGRGAYAAGTVAGSLTRRYHGLLIAPLHSPLGRHLVFAKADATLFLPDENGVREWPLFTNRWGSGAVEPAGHVHIESFHLDGRMPVWCFVFGALRIEMRVWMEQGADTVYVAYRPEFPDSWDGPRAVNLHVRLLVNARDHHGYTKPWDFNSIVEPGEGPSARALTVRNPAGSGKYVLQFQVRGGTIHPDHTWHEDFDLPIERERGLPERDNHLSVGVADLKLEAGEWSGLVASVEDNASPYLEEAMRRFQFHDGNLLTRTRVQVSELAEAPAWVQQLVLAADSFVFTRRGANALDTSGESVIAGYPWFGDWGRDTMIALPGLTLATGRFDTARQILETYAGFVDQGMLPNVFPGSGETAEYNSVDAALWYIEAWRAYVETSSDEAALARVFPVLESIVEHYAQGTRYGIVMDPTDGLLQAGEAGVQITWMDAKLGDWVVTPRIGKPVEINALWYNTLICMDIFAKRLGRSPTVYSDLASKAKDGFQRYLKADGTGLFDVLDGPNGDDASVRPNQLLAVSLPHSPLSEIDQKAVLRHCGRELLTSYWTTLLVTRTSRLPRTVPRRRMGARFGLSPRASLGLVIGTNGYPRNAPSES